MNIIEFYTILTILTLGGICCYYALRFEDLYNKYRKLQGYVKELELREGKK